MADVVLALNAGSSSIKFALFALAGAADPAPVLRGQLDGLMTVPHLVVRDPADNVLTERRWEDAGGQSHESLLDGLLGWIDDHLGSDKLVGVGHRVVHGGQAFTDPVLLDGSLLARLEALTPLAPLHQPHSLAPVRVLMAARPGLPQVACFDTAFHHTVPAIATRFALPFVYEQEGVRRYGFHGLSYEFIARHLRQRLPHLARGRVVVAHLGNGASLCAMRDGRSIDTTMGFTALDGLMMGTRCGTIDPGVLLYLLQQKDMTPQALEHLLYHQSGLLGVSGVSGDMRTLLASADPHAKDAIELFVFRIARETAALAASLGGIDGFVFTAGIGEHSIEIRDAVCERLHWLGVVTGRREPGTTRLSAAGSRVEVQVIATDEEAMIAHHTIRCLAKDEVKQ